MASVWKVNWLSAFIIIICFSLCSPAALSFPHPSIFSVTKANSHFWFLMALSCLWSPLTAFFDTLYPAVWCMLRASSPGRGSRSRSSPWGGGPGRSRARGRAWTRTRARGGAACGSWGGRYVARAVPSLFSCRTSNTLLHRIVQSCISTSTHCKTCPECWVLKDSRVWSKCLLLHFQIIAEKPNINWWYWKISDFAFIFIYYVSVFNTVIKKDVFTGCRFHTWHKLTIITDFRT